MHSLKLGQWNKEGLNMEEATGEPGLCCLSSLGSQRKGGLGDRVRGFAWISCQLPSALEHRWQTRGPWAESSPPPCFYPVARLSSLALVKE